MKMDRMHLYFEFFVDGVTMTPSTGNERATFLMGRRVPLPLRKSVMILDETMATAVEAAAIPEGPMTFPSVVGRVGLGITSPMGVVDMELSSERHVKASDYFNFRMETP